VRKLRGIREEVARGQRAADVVDLDVDGAGQHVERFEAVVLPRLEKIGGKTHQLHHVEWCASGEQEPT